jgi:hypothetical protein
VKRDADRCETKQWNRAKYHRCHQRERNRERDRHAIEAYLIETWKRWRAELQQQLHGEPRQSQADGAAEQRDERAFREEEPGDTPLTRAERAAYCDFALVEGLDRSRRDGRLSHRLGKRDGPR